MPVCKRCGRMATSVEMRRSPAGGALCKAKQACEVRRRQAGS